MATARSRRTPATDPRGDPSRAGVGPRKFERREPPEASRAEAPAPAATASKAPAAAASKAPAAAPSKAPVKVERVCLENQTVLRLSVRRRDRTGRHIIPPLGRLELPAAELELDRLRPAEAAGTIVIAPARPQVRPDAYLSAIAVWIVVFIACSLVLSDELWRWAARVAAAALVVIGVRLALRSSQRLQTMRGSLVELPRRAREASYLLMVLFIVVAVPGVLLFFGSEVPALYDAAVGGDHAATVRLIGIGVQGISIMGASSLPILLYFLFDREKLQTLRQKFIRHAFRLDPSIDTVADVQAKHGEVLDEIYGRRADNRFLPGARSPILLATAVLTLGWTIALLDTNAANLDARMTLSRLIEPTGTAATYAFLGAYFFTLNHVIRGYVRGDLRPKTYAQVAARTVGVVVLAFVLQRITEGAGGNPSNAVLLVTAFLAGIVPETVLVRLQETGRSFVRTPRGRQAMDRLARTYESEPLTQLDGIDIYDRARLLDEGVTNVEGLAHHDLVDLLLKTRIPAPRVVDWVDQAILYIHCSPASSGLEDGDGGRAAPSVLASLRRYGIRTATDLKHAHAKAKRDDREEQFLAIVPSEQGKPPVLRVVLDAIEDEEWMDNLEYWHARRSVPGVLMIPDFYERTRDEFGRYVRTAERR